MTTLVTNKGRVAISLPAPYVQTVPAQGSVTIADTLATVYASAQRTLTAAQMSALSFSVATVSAAPSTAAVTPAAATATTPTQTTSVPAYQTRITNLAAEPRALPAPYGHVVFGGQSVILLDSVASIRGNLSTLPYAARLLWQVSVVATDAPDAVIVYGPLDLKGQRARNAAEPTERTDLTTKGYVDAAIAAIPSPVTHVTMGGDVEGESGDSTVVALQGRALSPNVPTIGQVLGWDGSAWVPVDQSGSENGAPVTITLPTQDAFTAGDCVSVTPSGSAVRTEPAGTTVAPAIGIARAVRAGQVDVQMSGILDVFSELTPGRVYFAGQDGRPSLLAPGPGATVQHVGVAVSATQLMISPSLTTIRRA